MKNNSKVLDKRVPRYALHYIVVEYVILMNVLNLNSIKK